MTDILDEIQEDWQRERAVAFLKNYGVYLIGAVILLFVGTAGYAWWSHYQEEKQAEWGNSFHQALQQIAHQEVPAAIETLDHIAKESTSGMGQLAGLRKAALLVSAGKQKEAIDVYEKIAAASGGDAVFKQLAEVLSLYLQAEQSALSSEALQKLATLAKEGAPWAPLAIELQALHSLSAKHFDEARQYLTTLIEGTSTPENLRARAERMLAVLPDAAVQEAPSSPSSNAPVNK